MKSIVNQVLGTGDRFCRYPVKQATHTLDFNFYLIQSAPTILVDQNGRASVGVPVALRSPGLEVAKVDEYLLIRANGNAIDALVTGLSSCYKYTMFTQN